MCLPFLLAACSTNAIPEMSDEEMHQVEEYAAHLLLKYDANYEMTTVSVEEFEAQRAELERRARVQAQIAADKALAQAQQEEEQGESTAEQTEAPARESANVYTDIDDFFGESSFEIEYSGYEAGSTYPAETASNDWQGVVRATDGNSLLIFHFQISNTGASDAVLDMAGKGARFNFRINNSISKAALKTLRLDEFSMFCETIPAGGTSEAVLIVEIDAQTASRISALKMTMRYGEQRGELTLL